METNVSVMLSMNSSERLTLARYNTTVFISSFIPSLIYICCLLIIGIPGNALVCYIYQQTVRQKQLSTDIFILSLASFDLVNCLVSLPVEINLILNYVQFDQPVICKLHRFLTFFCNNSSSVILLVIAINRLVAFVSAPVPRRLKPWIAKAIIILAMIISGAGSWPMLLFMGTYKLPLPNGIILKICSVSNKYADQPSVLILVVTLLCFHILFDLLFLITYSITGKQICNEIRTIRSTYEHRNDHEQSFSSRESMVNVSSDLNLPGIEINHQHPNKRNSKLFTAKTDSLELTSIIYCHRSKNDTSRHHSKQTGVGTLTTSDGKIFNRRSIASKTSLMLFIVTVAYVLSFLPYCTIVVIRRVAGPTYYNGLNNTEKSLYQLFLRSYLLSSAINPVIYSFVNISFRRRCRQALRELCEIMCCFKVSKKK